MHSERIEIARQFIQAVRRHGMVLYQHLAENNASDWIEVSPSKVYVYTFSHLWVNAWTDKKFINYQELQSKGYTTPESTPVSAAHKIALEFHLIVNSSAPTESESNSKFQRGIEGRSTVAWFSGRLGRGKPSL